MILARISRVDLTVLSTTGLELALALDKADALPGDRGALKEREECSTSRRASPAGSSGREVGGWAQLAGLSAQSLPLARERVPAFLEAEGETSARVAAGVGR
jgi:hypothetical protein